MTVAINETLPLCPDTELGDGPAYTEPMEVGPFTQGIVFVKVLELSEGASVDASLGISPTGYADWSEDWTVLDSLEGLDETGVYALRVSNFGNWIRLRFTLDGDDALVLAWFVGDG